MCLCVDTPSVVDYGQELRHKFLNVTRAFNDSGHAEHIQIITHIIYCVRLLNT